MKSQVRDDLFAEFPIPLLKSKLADKIKLGRTDTGGAV